MSRDQMLVPAFEKINSMKARHFFIVNNIDVWLYCVIGPEVYSALWNI
jgi:hypothetical protein